MANETLRHKMVHLPVLTPEIRGGETGYFDLRPVEIGRITSEKTTDNDGNEVPRRNNVEYILGRTTDGDLVIGRNVDLSTDLVDRGIIFLSTEILDYTPKDSIHYKPKRD